MTQARAALVAAAWGLGEATWFFIVPDVWLTFVAVRRAKWAVWAAVAALAGALIGGSLLFILGNASPGFPSLLDRLPGVNAAMIDHVDAQLSQHGAPAILLGPLRGVPYKIFAAKAGARNIPYVEFLIMSILGRLSRFLLSVAVAAALRAMLARFTSARAIDLTLASLWTIFYITYFWRVGW